MLCSIPKPYNIDWVRDFYTELSVTSGSTLTVRKTQVTYNASLINNILGLPTVVDNTTFQNMLLNTSEAHYSKLLDRIAHAGAKWSFKANSRVLRTHCLKPEANVWFYFLRHSLYPTTHDTALCMVKVHILYCILEGIKFNVGLLISNNIFEGAERANARLPYPTIIHALMERAQVPVLTSDKLSTDKMSMDKLNIERLIRNNTYFSPNGEADSFASLKTTIKIFKAEIKASLRDYHLSIKKQIEEGNESVIKNIKEACLKEVKSQLNVWFNYEKGRDDAVRSYWADEHPRLLKNLPAFPLELLWAPANPPPTHL